MENIVQNFKYRKDKKIMSTPYQGEICVTEETFKLKGLNKSQIYTKSDFIEFCKQNGTKPSDYIVLCNYNIWNIRNKKILHRHTLVCQNPKINDGDITETYIIQDLPSKNNIAVSLTERNNDVDIWESINAENEIIRHKKNCFVLYPYLEVIEMNMRALVYNTIVDDVKQEYNYNIDKNLRTFDIIGMHKVPYINEYQPLYEIKNKGVCSNKQLKNQLCNTLFALKIDYADMDVGKFVNKYKNIHEELSDKHDDLCSL